MGKLSSPLDAILTAVPAGPGATSDPASASAAGRRPTAAVGPTAVLLVLLGISVSLPGCAGPRGPGQIFEPAVTELDAEERVPPGLRPTWSVDPEERNPEIPRPTVAPAVDDENVYLVYGDRLEARRLRDGHLARVARLPAPAVLPPVTLPDGIAVATEGALSWMRTDLGLTGRVDLPSPPRDVVVADGRVLAGLDAGVRAYAAATRIWELEIEGVDDLAGGADTLWVTAGPTLLAVDVAEGRVIWRRELEVELSSAPASDGTRLFATTVEQRLLALDAEGGEEVWSRSVGADVVGSPVVVDGLVWVAGFDSVLLGLTSSGTELYRHPLPSRTYVDLVGWGSWVVAGPRYGPWTLVRAPRRRSSSYPGELTVRTFSADPTISLAAGAGPAGIVLVSDRGRIRLLQPDPAQVGISRRPP